MQETHINLSQFPRVEPIPLATHKTALLKKHKISEDEFKRILEILERTPTMAELGVFSSMWSEHCSYKSSRIHLGRFPTKSPDVVQGPGENAGVVRIEDKLCAVFKMESHNHPSYIEPYQGAATGVGGILRDVFCMGARPIANLNCLRFGAETHPRMPYLFREVVRGIGDYGNCIGVPTVGGSVSFDETYDGNILVNAMTVGVIHEDRIFKGYASGPGNYVVYLGSATGRDGIHGATMASDSFSSQNNEERSTVQVGDPFTEKLLLEATLDLLKNELVVGLQDMGAAGLTSSSFEMAARAGSGLFIDLDKVPVRAENMTAYELLLSESQERMLLVVEPSKWPAVEKLLEKWQLSYGIIGYVTESQRVQIVYQGQLEVDIPVDPIADNAPKYDRPRQKIKRPGDDQETTTAVRTYIRQEGWIKTLELLLAMTGSKRFIHQQYDSQIGTKTILGPREEGASVLWPRSHWTTKEYVGIVASAGCNERYVAADPFAGACHAVLQNARQIAAVGGQPLAITDCLNYGNPEDPEIMEEFSQGVDGISEACRQIGTPVVSGNVSLYNETDGVSIAPTPMIGMVGKIADVREARPALLQEDADIYLMMPKTGCDFVFSSSRLARYLKCPIRAGKVPPLLWDAEREAISFLGQNGKKYIHAARDLGEGGVLTTLIKLMGDDFGLDIHNESADLHKIGFSDIEAWFADLAPAYLLAVKPGAQPDPQGYLKHNTLVKIAEARRDMEYVNFAGKKVLVSEVRASYHSSFRVVTDG